MYSCMIFDLRTNNAGHVYPIHVYQLTIHYCLLKYASTFSGNIMQQYIKTLLLQQYKYQFRSFGSNVILCTFATGEIYDTGVCLCLISWRTCLTRMYLQLQFFIRPG